MYVSPSVFYLIIIIICLLAILSIWQSSINVSYITDLKKLVNEFIEHRTNVNEHLEGFSRYIDELIEVMESQTEKLVNVDKAMLNLMSRIDDSDYNFEDLQKLTEPLDEDDLTHEEIRKRLKKQRPRLIVKYNKSK